MSNLTSPVVRRLDVQQMLQTQAPPIMGWIYLAGGNEGPLKIGWSKSPEDRVRSFQTGNHQELRVLAKREGSQSEERQLHNKLEAHRVRGEWFERWAGLDEFGLPLDCCARSELGCVDLNADELAVKVFIRGTLQSLFGVIAAEELQAREARLRFEVGMLVEERDKALDQRDDYLRLIGEAYRRWQQ